MSVYHKKPSTGISAILQEKNALSVIDNVLNSMALTKRLSHLYQHIVFGYKRFARGLSALLIIIIGVVLFSQQFWDIFSERYFMDTSKCLDQIK